MLKNNDCIQSEVITNRAAMFPEDNWPMTCYGGDVASAEGRTLVLKLL